MGRVVLVTGVSRDLGGRFARQLSGAVGVDRVIGVDVTPPRGDMGSVQFVRADIRNPVIAKIIAREHVDTVVHLGLQPQSRRGARSSVKELNVIGTMQLLAGCQQAPDLQHLVLKSSTDVYGATSRDPAMFTEEMSARRLGTGFAKDVHEVESYTRGFARRRPDVRVTMLRTSGVLAPDVSSQPAEYLKLPVIPTALGFDARIQFMHAQDQLDALEHATLADVPGTFNISADGVMLLSQIIRRLGKPSLPVPGPALGQVGGLLRGHRRVDFNSEQVAYLTYGRGVDTTRMHQVLGFHPARTTQQTFAEYADAVAPGPFSAERVRAVESALAGALGAGSGGGGSRG